MCDLDAGCSDGGAPDASTGDGGAPVDGGMSMMDASAPASDAGASDASVPDGGSTPADPGSVAACSCETALNSDGLIHVCTGSFDRDTCRAFDCEQGSPRAARCPQEAVRLCCTMEARHLYSELYEDCTHPNCMSGFRAQCEEFGGLVSVGACDTPALPDDPDTDTGGSDCSLARGRRGAGAAYGLVLLVLGWFGLRRGGNRKTLRRAR
jgi:hypothetical protein